MLIATCARFILLGSLPDGVYPDEAYNAYNTWSMMVEGIDSRGYHAPVYFIAWGSGMNVLYAYLALPFFRLFGASLFVFRLPQALVSLAGVAAFYVLGRACFDKATGYLMAFALEHHECPVWSGIHPGSIHDSVCADLFCAGIEEKSKLPLPVRRFHGCLIV